MKSPALIPLLLMVLAGCSKPQASVPALPVDEKVPVAAAESTAPPTKSGQATLYIGTWSAKDGQGQVFDVVIFPNGQAVSTWTKGPAGAQGERGFWRLENNRLIVFFNDGWTDVISEKGGEFSHSGFEPGSALDGTPKNESPAKRLEPGGFTGIWRFNKEPDGSYLYVAMQSSGRAFSTIGGGTEGTWEQTKDGILCKWPDGWNDLIYSASEGYQKRSWVGPAEQNTTPPDISPALRVGEEKFSITP